MPDAGGSDSAAGAGPSLFASVRSFWSVLLAIFYTRLDLATAELEDEAARAAKLVISALVSVLCFHAALLFALLFLLAAVWETPYKLPVIGGIFLLYLVLGIAGVLIARNIVLTRPKFLSQTIAELRRDVEGLQRAIGKKEGPAD